MEEIQEMKVCPKYCKNLGSYNYLPEPYAPCDIGEFYYRFFSYDPEVIEFRQCEAPWEAKPVLPRTYRGVHNCRIFWFHDIAYALFVPDKWEHKGWVCRYVDTPRCYRIGCEHDWVELGQRECSERGIVHFGMCFHVEECKKCFLVQSFDSSD